MNTFVRSSALVALLGLFTLSCAPTAPSESSGILNKGAEYKDNISTLYSLESPATGLFEVKWKDSLGTIRSLRDYPTKVVMLSFCKSKDTNCEAHNSVIDSIFRTHSDSVQMVTVLNDFTTHSFVSDYNYVMANGWKSQFVVDSLKSVFINFVQLSDGDLGIPQTFIITPSGSLDLVRKGQTPYDTLVNDFRKAFP